MPMTNVRSITVSVNDWADEAVIDRLEYGDSRSTEYRKAIETDLWVEAVIASSDLDSDDFECRQQLVMEAVCREVQRRAEPNN